MLFLYIGLITLALMCAAATILYNRKRSAFREELDFHICAYLHTMGFGRGEWVEMQTLHSVMTGREHSYTPEEFEAGLSRMEREGYVERCTISGILYARNVGEKKMLQILRDDKQR